MNTNQDNRIEELKKIIKPYVQNQEAIETLTEICTKNIYSKRARVNFFIQKS